MASIKTSKGGFKYKSRILFPGLQVINKEIAHENLVLLQKILDSHNLNWGLAFGSLLGAVREHDFIDWDEDIDLYVIEEEEEIFKNALWELRDAGFELIRYERRGLYSIRRKGEYMDFYVLSKINDELRQTKGGGYIFEKYLRYQVDVDFRGIKIRVPRKYDEYLTFQYGEWRTPVRFYNPKMNIIKKFLLVLYYYIRMLMPDKLYFRLLRKRHIKDFEKFKEKCIKKGCPLPEGLELPK